jgi:hypothetical protein
MKKMMPNIDVIGFGSSLTPDDRHWLEVLADKLYDEGSYVKSIYLCNLLYNADISERCIAKNNG